MGAGGGFGMILDAKDGFALMAHAFDGLVVEVDAVHGNIRRESPGVHSETVVLGGDFDFAGGEVFDGLIRAAMAEFEFEGFAAERLAQNLVAEADAEDGHAGFDEVADGLDRVAEGGRVAGAVGKKNARGFILQGVRGGSGGGDDLGFETVLPETAEDVVFHPEIEGDNGDIGGREGIADVGPRLFSRRG
jgi:hypothetical protein